jgi:hypothetical protein
MEVTAPDQIGERLLCSVLMAALVLPVVADAGGFWKRAARPTDVEISVEIRTPAEIDSVRESYGHSGRRNHDRHAFTVLTRSRSTGAWRCRVYVSEETNKIMEHELRHCDGWIHE